MQPSNKDLDRAATARAILAVDRPQRGIIFEKLAPDVVLPERGTADAAGYDLRAYLLGSPVKLNCGGGISERGADTSVTPAIFELLPGEAAIIPLGFKAAIPKGFEVQIRPRSGTAFKKRMLVVNAPGTIDADYRGEWGVVVMNPTATRLVIEHGERIAQMVIGAVVELPMSEGLLDQTARGEGGFGSTGTR